MHSVITATSVKIFYCYLFQYLDLHTCPNTPASKTLKAWISDWNTIGNPNPWSSTHNILPKFHQKQIDLVLENYSTTWFSKKWNQIKESIEASLNEIWSEIIDSRSSDHSLPKFHQKQINLVLEHNCRTWFYKKKWYQIKEITYPFKLLPLWMK